MSTTSGERPMPGGLEVSFEDVATWAMKVVFKGSAENVNADYMKSVMGIISECVKEKAMTEAVLDFNYLETCGDKCMRVLKEWMTQPNLRPHRIYILCGMQPWHETILEPILKLEDMWNFTKVHSTTCLHTNTELRTDDYYATTGEGSTTTLIACVDCNCQLTSFTAHSY